MAPSDETSTEYDATQHTTNPGQPVTAESALGGGAGEVDGVPFSAPEFAPQAAAPQPAARDDSAGGGEAILAAMVFGFAVSRFTGQPLTPAEKARFVEDLTPVLKKHNVPAMLPPEETQLVSTVVEIVAPRVAAMGATDDQSLPGETRERQERSTPQGGLPRKPGTIRMPSLA